jgi:hypothetical protein
MTRTFPDILRAFPEVSHNLRPAELLKLLLRNVASVNHYYILCYPLGRLPPGPPPKLGGSGVELLQPEDLADLYRQLPSLQSADRRELLARILFYKGGFKNCYAIRANASVAYIQWIIYPSENDLLMAHHKHRFLPLARTEVMIENVFTSPACRGRGFLPFGSWQLLHMAREQGYSRAITYVRKDRIIALNSFLQSGFKISRLVREYKILGTAWRIL